ncbi:MAG: hypothetical protein WBQ94_13485 [Terracidiphilus sp.]
MQVKHLLETLGYLDPELLIFSDGGKAPHLRLSSRWKVETEYGSGDDFRRHIGYSAKESDAKLFAKELAAKGHHHPVITRVDVLVFC